MRFLSFLLFALLAACSSNEKGLKVAGSPVPHAEILEFVKQDLKEEGVNLIIIPTDDYNIPNRALADRELDANFFQHRPFLEMQKEAFHYPLIELTAIEIEPMGLYSNKIKTLADLKSGSKVAIPNDPSNEARALFLLESQGLIELKPKNNPHSTLLNISKNEKNLSFIELDAAMIPRTLADVDLAAINTNYALEAGLNPLKDALAKEGKDSPYANILVIREGDESREDIQALKKALTSEKMREFLKEKYRGAIIPAW